MCILVGKCSRKNGIGVGAVQQEAENFHLQSETQTGVGKPEGTGGLELSEPFLSNILPLERLDLQKTAQALQVEIEDPDI